MKLEVNWNMFNTNHNTGFAIALAWPETYCKQAGSWYEFITVALGINRNNYYKAGHAAMVLVDGINKTCHYFDFGRYHTPFQHGRVRSALTDHELAMTTIPKLSPDGNSLENYHDILNELQNNPACHGQGKLHASYSKIDFRKAFAKATHMQRISPIPYGPFRYKGSNCSRFVNTSLLAGNPGWIKSFRLKYMVPLTPMPLNNVNSFENKIVIEKQLKTENFCPLQKLDNNLLKSTLPQPTRHESIPQNAQWLSGEGAGSWFSIAQKDGAYFIKRQSPDGSIECSGLFKVINSGSFTLNEPFHFDYPSYCNQVTIRQHQKIVHLIKV